MNLLRIQSQTHASSNLMNSIFKLSRLGTQLGISFKGKYWLQLVKTPYLFHTFICYWFSFINYTMLKMYVTDDYQGQWYSSLMTLCNATPLISWSLCHSGKSALSHTMEKRDSMLTHYWAKWLDGLILVLQEFIHWRFQIALFFPKYLDIQWCLNWEWIIYNALIHLRRGTGGSCC